MCMWLVMIKRMTTVSNDDDAGHAIDYIFAVSLNKYFL